MTYDREKRVQIRLLTTYLCLLVDCLLLSLPLRRWLLGGTGRRRSGRAGCIRGFLEGLLHLRLSWRGLSFILGRCFGRLLLLLDLFSLLVSLLAVSSLLLRLEHFDCLLELLFGPQHRFLARHERLLGVSLLFVVVRRELLDF